MTQLVVSGNRILAHGEDCFLAMGGTVICTQTERKFENATVVFHEGGIPSDIDSVGYEYHAGEFVPCAPYGKGTGTLAVVCDECGTIKDSGVSVSNLCKVIKKEYDGTGGQASLSVDGIIPLFAVISKNTNDTWSGTKISGTITQHGGYSTRSYSPSSAGLNPKTNVAGLQSWFEGNTLKWECPVADSDTNTNEMGLNESGAKYTAIVIGMEVV